MALSMDMQYGQSDPKETGTFLHCQLPQERKAVLFLAANFSFSHSVLNSLHLVFHLVLVPF